jgi:Asp-tRNA(Asn)/Glu-tRNA(Gln) amidotransferase A subunit family amidase
MADLARDHWDEMSGNMQAAIRRGRDVSEAQYQEALGVKASAATFFLEHFNEFDAILAPAATGEAPPLKDGSTGDSIFCTIWTLAGLPTLSLPLLVGTDNLPVGVQIIGAVEEDDRLMRTSSWIQRTLSDQNGHRE